MLRDLSRQRVLLLQGPNGPFFWHFARDLRARGCEVTKVNFNAGDDHFYQGPDVVRFCEELERWPAFFRALCGERHIEALFLFGDCRPIHRRVIPIAEELGITVWVLEEGYLRPDYVTIERGGVNGHSQLPRDPEFYRRATVSLPDLEPPVAIGNAFWHQAWWTASYATLSTFRWYRYPHYRHHRDHNAFRQAYLWVRGAVLKGIYALEERGVLERLTDELAGRYFLVPLQVHLDAQLQHSDFESLEQFMAEVVAAFAAHAPPGTVLVVKQHPHDRPYRDYRQELAQLGEHHGCADRIVYVHDLHLPTLLKHARGVITINSTVGLSALYHGTPVKVLGRAVYDVPGLTSERPLGEFLAEPGRVDASLFRAFQRWLREDNQVNGSFYRRHPALGTASGLDATALAPPEAPARPAEADRAARR